MKLPGETHLAYLIRIFGTIGEQTKQKFEGLLDSWYEERARAGLEELANDPRLLEVEAAEEDLDLH